jgi:hypothetical protein
MLSEIELQHKRERKADRRRGIAGRRARRNQAYQEMRGRMWRLEAAHDNHLASESAQKAAEERQRKEQDRAKAKASRSFSGVRDFISAMFRRG